MKPKADVIYTGHMRTFAACLHSQRWHVLRHYDPTFYVSTVRDEQTDSYKLLHGMFPDSAVHLDIVESQPDIPEPAEPVRFEPYARSVPVQAVLRQLWQLERGWALRQEAGSQNETVIRIRPDLFFHSCERVAGVDLAEVLAPYWGRFGGVNDRFAIMGDQAARHYFTTYTKLAKLLEMGCPLHPESLVKASIESAGCHVISNLITEFTTARLDGTGRPPEVTVFDLAALRAV